MSMQSNLHFVNNRFFVNFTILSPTILDPLVVKCNPLQFMWVLVSIFPWLINGTFLLAQIKRRLSFVSFALSLKRSLRGIIPDTTTSFSFGLIDEARLAVSYAISSGCPCLLKSFVPQWITIILQKRYSYYLNNLAHRYF